MIEAWRLPLHAAASPIFSRARWRWHVTPPDPSVAPRCLRIRRLSISGARGQHEICEVFLWQQRNIWIVLDQGQILRRKHVGINQARMGVCTLKTIVEWHLFRVSAEVLGACEYDHVHLESQSHGELFRSA